MEEDCAVEISQSDRFGIVGKCCQVYFPFTTLITISTRSLSWFLHADLPLRGLSAALLPYSWNIIVTPSRHQVAVFFVWKAAEKNHTNSATTVDASRPYDRVITMVADEDVCHPQNVSTMGSTLANSNPSGVNSSTHLCWKSESEW